MERQTVVEDMRVSGTAEALLSAAPGFLAVSPQQLESFKKTHGAACLIEWLVVDLGGV